MPVTVDHPGTFIEERETNAHRIVAAATAIAAFVGLAVKGPVSTVRAIYGFHDFEAIFGGLAADYPLGYAVRDFFDNGGDHALIVRIFAPSDLSPEPSGAATIALDGLRLAATSPGEWGNTLSVTIDFDVPTGIGADDAGSVFNLSVRTDDDTETYRHVTVTDDPRRLDRVLSAQSALIAWDGDWPAMQPSVAAAKAAAARLTDAVGKLSVATAALAAAEAAEPARASDVEVARDACTAAKSAVDEESASLTGRGAGGTDSLPLEVADYIGSAEHGTGRHALDRTDIFNLLCIPPERPVTSLDPEIYRVAMQLCRTRRAVALIDAPFEWSAVPASSTGNAIAGLDALGLTGDDGSYAALYFPSLLKPDPLRDDAIGEFAPCGAVAGIIARTDRTRGVWKAPAGMEAEIREISGLRVELDEFASGLLNAEAINCLRTLPRTGSVLWGARTLQGADRLADPFKYLPVRRTTCLSRRAWRAG